MRGNPQYRTQFLRRERQNERQTGRQEGRRTGRQEGKRGGELRRWVQRCTARFTARGTGRESAPHWNRRSLRRSTALSLRRSVIPKGFATLFWTVPQRFPASGQSHKQFRSTSDAVPQRCPSEDPMNRSESTAPQPAYTIAGCSRQRLRA